MEAPIDVAPAGERAAVQHRSVSKLSTHDTVDTSMVLVEPVKGSDGRGHRGNQACQRLGMGDSVDSVEVSRDLVGECGTLIVGEPQARLSDQHCVVVGLG